MRDRKLYLKSYGGPIDPVALLCGFSIPKQREQKTETEANKSRVQLVKYYKEHTMCPATFWDCMARGKFDCHTRQVGNVFKLRTHPALPRRHREM